MTRLSALIDSRPDEGIFRVNRAMFDDPAVFELEMRHIFEAGWLFLGLAAQAPDAHDYFTVNAGRVPVLVMRGGDGVLRGFVNSCPHKGARVAHAGCGHARQLICPYHSWSFDSSGKNKAVKWKAGGAYTPGFDADSHDLPALPAFGVYKGFVFGSVSADVPPLLDWLGDAAKLLDLVADQSEEGVEMIPGGVSFTYDANWKLQLENCSDNYHFTSAHPSYIRLLERRKAAEAASGKAFTSAMDSQRHWSGEDDEIVSGTFSFPYGHVLNFGLGAPTPASPLFDRADLLAQRLGAAKRDWIFNMRNLTIFPNLQVAENASSQLRVIEPLSAGRTRMRTWCIGPKGEAPAARRQRIRQYEDFFNPSGMATPDDTVAYEDCQRGFAGKVEPWLQGYARGMDRRQAGPNDLAGEIGLEPEFSVAGNSRLCDETIYQSYYREWARRMAGALETAA
ncbi:aromatic-ring-hydroxylating dioxygenase alpha subunit [Sphingobium sp. SYK-6]|uniref:aromatic ring-hydroxylating oxygenase subunit alpha n=1 Tax=Sphingobium sp. (strain NBRC 103272 / SYK-6) TaxID=627192 RepID=UPI000227707A|nr:aromatic ring-hydroxylating dioxygenase subunit alpha [Sphingobium sp. SYK-6]BAK66339.1 aromatic-ring-hydroxylating dioxygenase alpha subunit [Sphingobium sp. SYK-6]